MNGKNILLGLALVLSLAVFNPQIVLAGEHGGTEHGGAEMAAEHMEGSHGMTESHAATLTEAASILEKEGHSDLAKKLKAMAEMEG